MNLRGNFIFSALIMFLFFTACRASKKALTDTPKSDNTAHVTPSDSLTFADSLRWAIKAFQQSTSRLPIYQTLQAKIKIDFESDRESFQGTLSIRLRKDSLIWLSATGPLGIEAFRALIRPDSITLMDKLEKSVLQRPISFLQEQLKLPLDFYALQDLLIGNAFFADSSFSGFKIEQDTIELLFQNNGFTNIIHLNRQNALILDNTLYDKSMYPMRSANFIYSGYTLQNGIDFSMQRVIKITDTMNKKIELTFKQIDFDQPQTFPFNIPNYYFIK